MRFAFAVALDLGRYALVYYLTYKLVCKSRTMNDLASQIGNLEAIP